VGDGAAIPASRASLTSSTPVIPQSTVISSRVPRSASRATVAAESEALCYRLDKRGFEAIIRARPELADAMSKTVAARQAANDATLASLSAEARARATGTRANELVRRIRSFFGLNSE